MNTQRRISPHRLLVPFLILGLTAAACAQSPTAAPTLRPAPTTAPVKPAPTTAPTVAPTKLAPTATPAPKPTAAPTKAPPTAPTTMPTAQPTPAPLALGTGRLVGDLMVNPGRFEELVSSGTDKPKAGDEYVVVTVSFENTSKTGTLKLDPASLLLVDTQSNTNISPATLKSLKNQLTAQDLKPGAKLEGVIAFEVAKKDVGSLELMFKGANNQNVLWSLKSVSGSLRLRLTNLARGLMAGRHPQPSHR